MIEKWLSISESLGKQGPEEGTILLDDELPDMARITIEKKLSSSSAKDFYPVTIGIYGLLVHTAFFENWEDALACTKSLKLVIQALKRTS